MGKMQRTKGARNERRYARVLRASGLDAERMIQQSRVVDTPDVKCIVRPTSVLENVVFLFECKDYASPTWGLAVKALEQSEEFVTDDSQIAAAAIHLPNTSRDVVFMDREVFLRLVGAPAANESSDSKRSAA